MSRTIWLVLAVSVVCLLAYARPSLAGHGAMGAGPHGGGATMPGLSVAPSHEGGGAGPAEVEPGDNPHSNKGGKVRGLERANEVAGEHGEQGRSNAAEHGNRHHKHGDKHHKHEHKHHDDH